MVEVLMPFFIFLITHTTMHGFAVMEWAFFLGPG
jgi:hypothetical protein